MNTDNDPSEKTNRRFQSAKLSTEDKILNAAYRCFNRRGIQGTKAEEIAIEAKISKATLYRYFASKDAIVDQVSIREIEKATTAIRKILKAEESIEQTLVEGLFLSTRLAGSNPCVQALAHDSGFTSRTSDATSPQQKAFLSTWGKLITKAMKTKKIAADLTEESVGNWLYVNLEMLILTEEDGERPDEELRYFIKRFIVRPLLP